MSQRVRGSETLGLVSSQYLVCPGSRLHCSVFSLLNTLFLHGCVYKCSKFHPAVLIYASNDLISPLLLFPYLIRKVSFLLRQISLFRSHCTMQSHFTHLLCVGDQQFVSISDFSSFLFTVLNARYLLLNLWIIANFLPFKVLVSNLFHSFSFLWCVVLHEMKQIFRPQMPSFCKYHLNF